ncbi:D-inositol 3-phosphate glycosyltransferase [Pirellulimonas nuda]|uniref:D-inositol 3-phosphate glycosyltransferase n=1 Tax=Pirellulimonas nuda TaxID=2528009 RepID=A0A518DGB8_9BACT|nr:glycosyltransferase family 1 protein [Pirellulimonas nuda]QDU90520.1 D-inositol 3-phosphate glycosyltransferase [Pirellulimonas nuda]
MSVASGDRLTVLVDGVVFENRSQIGIWRVFYETLSRLGDGFDVVVVLAGDAVQELPAGVSTLRLGHRYPHGSKLRFDRRWRRRQIIRRIDHHYPNAIWHSTYFTFDPRVRPRSVVTVYDLIAEELFYANRNFEEHAQDKRAAILQASAISTISHDTKQKLLQYYPDLSCPVSVATLGAEHIVPPAEPSPVREPFALFVGDRYGYKNFSILVDAVASTQWPEYLRVKVVGAPFSEAESRLLECRGVRRRFEHEGRVDDAMLATLYRRSTCFVFPSLNEGFGLPAVEAQSLGTIPVVSDLPVFREVCGSGAYYFDPHFTDSLCRAIQQVCQIEDRPLVVEACQKNAQRFRWQATADAMAEVYRSVAGLNGSRGATPSPPPARSSA